jgi:hypothetical protein
LNKCSLLPVTISPKRRLDSLISAAIMMPLALLFL